MKISKILKIHGKVQGVYYRESMKTEARRLGLTGWVRNRKDGSVEALVQGEESLVDEMLAWCRRGPPSAQVEKLEERNVAPELGLEEFLRKETE